MPAATGVHDEIQGDFLRVGFQSVHGRKLFYIKEVDSTSTKSAESLNTLGSESVFAGSWH